MHKEGYDILDQHSCFKDDSHLITFKVFLTRMKFHTDFYVYGYVFISLKRRSIDFYLILRGICDFQKGKGPLMKIISWVTFEIHIR